MKLAPNIFGFRDIHVLTGEKHHVFTDQYPPAQSDHATRRIKVNRFTYIVHYSVLAIFYFQCVAAIRMPRALHL